MNWQNNGSHNLTISSIFCYFDIDHMAICIVYIKKESDDYSHFFVVMSHVNVYFLWFKLCTNLVIIYTYHSLSYFVQINFTLNSSYFFLWVLTPFSPCENYGVWPKIAFSYKIDNWQDFLPQIQFDISKDVSFAYYVFIFILLPSFSFSSTCFQVFHVDVS